MSVVDDVDIWFESWQAIFKDVLGIISTTAKIVPELQNIEHRPGDVDDVQR